MVLELRRGFFLSFSLSDTPHYENVPFEVPESWVWCKLDDLAYVGTGATPLTKRKDYYYKGEIAWINSSSTSAPYIDKASNFITQKAISETNCVIYPKGTLILAMYGEGKTRGQISELLIEAATNQACAAICPFLQETKEYIKIFFESNYLHLRTLAEGGTQPNLNLGKISNYDIPFPPIGEQNRIVVEIKRRFALVDIIERGKENLQTAIKQTKSKILDLAIHGKLVPQDPTDEPASELLKRINPKAEIACDNGHYTQLPDSWCFCSLESLCSFISRGKSPKYSDRDRTYPVFAQKCNLKDGEISLEQAKFLDPSTINKWPQKYRLKTGDVLINSTGTGTVGRTRLFNQKYLAGYPFVVPDSHVSVIRTYDKICSEYVYTFMSSSSSQQFLEENLAGSTNQKELYIDVLKNMVISLPPYQEQLRIVSAIQKTFAKLDMIKESL